MLSEMGIDMIVYYYVLESLDPDFVRVMALEALEFTPGRSQTEEYRSGKYLEVLDG
jgi:hypothetical protein